MKERKTTLWILVNYGKRYGTNNILYIVGFFRHKSMFLKIMDPWFFVLYFAISMPLL